MVDHGLVSVPPALLQGLLEVPAWVVPEVAWWPARVKNLVALVKCVAVVGLSVEH